MPRKVQYHKKKLARDVVGNPTHYDQQASVKAGGDPPPGEGWKYSHSFTDKSGVKWDMYQRRIDLGHTIKEEAKHDAVYERARREAARGEREAY